MPEGTTAAKMPELSDAGYSTAYSEIIGNDDNLINMIAYCLYKKQKTEFIKKYGLPFNDDRVRTYHHDLNEDRIRTLKVAASTRLQDYANTIQDTVRTDEADKILDGTIISTITGLMKENHAQMTTVVKSETVWWKAVIYSIIGGFALGLIIVGASRMGFMDPFEALPAAQGSSKDHKG